MTEKKAIILLGINEETTDNSVKNLLKKLNFEILECTDGIEAVRKSFKKNPDLIILDVGIPSLNGYQCTRLLKNDQILKETSIILISSSGKPIEHYWSKISGADVYFTKPVEENKLEKVINTLLSKKNNAYELFPPNSQIQNMKDHAIVSMAANLMEEDLLQASILNEISMIDIFEVSIKELVTFVMKIIESLYSFKQGAVLLIYERHSELFFYDDPDSGQDSLDNTRKFIFNHLKNRYGVSIDPANTKEKRIAKKRAQKNFKQGIDDIYIHTRRSIPIRCLLSFTKIEFKKHKKNDQEKLNSALDLAREILEKKMYFEMTQEFSIIDIVTGNYSLAFLMTVLDREMKNATRHGYSITLFTIGVSEFKKITKNIEKTKINNLILNIQNLIFRTTRKIDIVARWNEASFAFLFTHTSREGASVAQKRIKQHFKNNISKILPSETEINMDIGISQFNIKRDHTAEEFFISALPEQIKNNKQIFNNLNLPQHAVKNSNKSIQTERINE
jgi:twitching motility two-component system response regulator PilH